MKNARQGLTGRDLAEMNAAMGIGTNTPKAPSTDALGCFTIHTVRPSDMPKLTLPRPTVRAIAGIDSNDAKLLATMVAPLQASKPGINSEGLFEIPVVRPSDMRGVR